MITSFEVGSIFRIIDQASPTLRLILRQVRDLNVALDKARESLAGLGKFAMPTGLTAAVAETGALAKAWGDVAKNAELAQRAIGGASKVAARTACLLLLRVQRRAAQQRNRRHSKNLSHKTSPDP
jgi:hypothetical protein